MAGPNFDDRDGWIWLDGRMVEWRDAKVHMLTHALHYASAVFEGERAYGGRIFKSAEHSRRLKEFGSHPRLRDSLDRRPDRRGQGRGAEAQ